jgi:hypothetical protein
VSKSLVKQVCVFSFFVAKLVRHSGTKGAVLYLKACQVLLQQVVGGYRVVDLSELKVRPRRNRAGLPLVIPAGVRVRISRDRNISDIRLWMTLFGLYRILDFRGRLSLSTITDPGVDLSKFLPQWDLFIKNSFVPLLRKKAKFGWLEKPAVYPILKSSPTTSSEMGGSVSTSSVDIKGSAWLWDRVPFCSSYSNLAWQLGAPGIPERQELLGRAFDKSPSFTPTYLGKLGFKIEPAGKVRVFAMVDAWTQWLLRPLHRWLFGILRQISTVDGTFNQKSPIFRLQALYANNAKGLSFASIDLSAATDRLPIALQTSVLKHLLRGVVPDAEDFAECWKSILIDRPYKVSISKEVEKGCEIPSTLPKDVMYEVGQPMGALSSWAMLAMTHHAIVQFAARRAGFKTWFDRYAILGDDIVIAHGGVAYQYRLILQEIGVKAGLAKSILARSRFVVEFAKSFFVDSETANALPLKECVATRSSTALVVEFMKKYQLSLNSILAFLGYGYRSRSRAVKTELFQLSTRMRVLLVWLAKPGTDFGLLRWSEWLFLRSWYSLHYPHDEVLIKIIHHIDSLAEKKARRMDEAVYRYFKSLEDIVSMLDRVTPLVIPSDFFNSPGEEQALPWSSFLHPESTYRTLASFKDKTRFIRYKKKVPIISKEYWVLLWISFLKVIHNPQASFKKFHKWIILKLFGTGRPRLLLDNNLGKKTYKEFLDKWHAIIRANPYGDPFLDTDNDLVLYSLSTQELLEVIDGRLEWLVNFDPLTELLPTSFWPQERDPPVKFKDFLSIYKLWQEVSRPVWADFYSKKSRSVALGPNDGVGCLSVTVYTKVPMHIIKWRLIKEQLLTPTVILIRPIWWKHFIDRIISSFIYYEKKIINHWLTQPLLEVILFILLLNVIGNTEVWGYESPHYLIRDCPEPISVDLTYIYNFIYWLGAVSLVLVASIALVTIRDLEDKIVILEDEVLLRSTETIIKSTRIIEQNSTIADLVSSLEIATLLGGG